MRLSTLTWSLKENENEKVGGSRAKPSPRLSAGVYTDFIKDGQTDETGHLQTCEAPASCLVYGMAYEHC
jgi:hypothetical protein